jgi:hypothetical protein
MKPEDQTPEINSMKPEMPEDNAPSIYENHIESMKAAFREIIEHDDSNRSQAIKMLDDLNSYTPKPAKHGQRDCPDIERVKEEIDDFFLVKGFERGIKFMDPSDYIIEITELLCHDNLNHETLRDILEKYHIDKIEDIKNELLDLIICYIHFVLADGAITESESMKTKTMKRYFKIKEGDFYTFKRAEIDSILEYQFSRLYADNMISPDEAIFNVGLQGLFDLSYDQYDKFKEKEVRKSLMQGAKITDLDTAISLKPTSDKLEEKEARRSLARGIKITAWDTAMNLNHYREEKERITLVQTLVQKKIDDLEQQLYVSFPVSTRSNCPR